MNILSTRKRRRLRLAGLGVFLIVVTYYLIHSRTAAQPSDGLLPDFNIEETRRDFQRPIIHEWSKSTETRGVEANCKAYFKYLKQYPRLTRPPGGGFDFEPRIYRKKKWMINAKKHLRRLLHEKGEKWSNDYLPFLEEKYAKDMAKISQFERFFVEQMSFLRVLGRCALHEYDSYVDFKDQASRKVLASLIPWYQPPTGENIDLLATLRSKPEHARGIVIPILPGTAIELQTDNVKRLLRVLRFQKNPLPVEIIYSGKATLSEAQKYTFLEAAGASQDKNKQNIEFRDVEVHVAPKIKVHSNLMLALAAIFNSFEDFIVLTHQVIPTAESLESLFEDRAFQEQGMLFFKGRPLVDDRPNPFPPGFFEVNELINVFAGVDSRESKVFDLEAPRRSHTKWVSDLGFTKLLDPSLLVFNKRKTLSGLVMSSILPFHDILTPKFQLSSAFNPDLIWLGQELAGTCNFVNFNQYFASAPGVLTPPENLPETQMARELCSSSWSQIYNDKLFYVTTHQLENRVLPDFAPAVRDRLLVKIPESPFVSKLKQKNVKDDSLAKATVDKNILFIKSVLQPMAADGPQVNRNGEPFTPTNQIADFGSSNNYWCSYDIVGSIDSPSRGLIYDFEEKDTERFLGYMEAWLHS